MKYQISSINLLILLASIVSQGYLGWASPGGFAKSHTPRDFDILILSQSWLPTVCETNEKYRLRHFCSVINNYERWSIHGLWPQKQKNPGSPEYCDQNKTNPFDMKKINDCIPDLQTKWVDVYAVNNLNNKEDIGQSFWAKEWKKHGTCAVDIKNEKAQKEYFEKSMTLYDKYDMRCRLSNVGIIPGNEYKYFDFSSKIKNATTTECQFGCRKDESSTKQWLIEIRICFDKKGKPINCDKPMTTQFECMHNVSITYPKATVNTKPGRIPIGPGLRGAPTGAGRSGVTYGADSKGAPSRADQSKNWRSNA